MPKAIEPIAKLDIFLKINNVTLDLCRQRFEYKPKLVSISIKLGKVLFYV